MSHAGHAPAVSVIVPAYNVERYLPECLDSLLAQTFADFEILVIDDGSTDGSPTIIARYAQEQPDRIRVFSKPNGGLGDARNFGIDRAYGAYLAFVDADDVVEPTMLADLHGLAIAQGADLVICGIRQFTDADGPSPYLPEPDMSVFGASLAEEPRLLFRVDASACDKLYARELFERSGVRFPVGMAFEDVPATYRLLPFANRVEKIDEPLYLYRRQRVDSISSEYGARYLDLVEAFRMLNGWYRESGLYESNRDALLRLNLTHLIAGRYTDLLLYADARARGVFLRSAFALLESEFPGWRHSGVVRELWANPLLRVVSVHRALIAVTARLPRRVYLRLLGSFGAFDPLR